jgi:hypothetical protein
MFKAVMLCTHLPGVKQGEIAMTSDLVASR